MEWEERRKAGTLPEPEPEAPQAPEGYAMDIGEVSWTRELCLDDAWTYIYIYM